MTAKELVNKIYADIVNNNFIDAIIIYYYVSALKQIYNTNIDQVEYCKEFIKKFPQLADEFCLFLKDKYYFDYLNPDTQKFINKMLLLTK